MQHGPRPPSASAAAEVVIDKLAGRIAQLVADKARSPTEAARRPAADALDDYINSYSRR